MYSNSDQRLGTLKDLAILAKELHESVNMFKIGGLADISRDAELVSVWLSI